MTLRQDVRFCTAADGTRIAVASIGSGPPLVRAAHWLSHVERDLESPVWRPWVQELSRHHTYIRYDQRGCGLSDRTLAGLSLDTFVGDLETVVDQLGLERFPLIGMSQGGAVAMRYASRHPERVSALVLVGAYARGALRRAASDLERLEAETLVNLIRVGWGRDNDAFRQVFTNQYIPEGTAEQHRWWNDLERDQREPGRRGANARRVPRRRRHRRRGRPARADARRPFAPRRARAVRRRPPPRRADSRRALPRPRERQPRPARGRAGVAGVRRGAATTSSARPRAAAAARPAPSARA